MPKPVATILSLADVTVAELPQFDVPLQGVSLTLDPGDLATVLLDVVHTRTPLPDVICGTLTPESGKVCFLDRDWHRTGPTAAGRMRGKIGRVFDQHGWISNLNVDENVLLPHVHHRHGSEAQLARDAQRWATQFGLATLPDTRPVATKPDDLRRAACVRAFLGEPRLLLLERPTFGASPDLLPALVAAVTEARARGAAALWIESLSEPFDHPELNPTARFKMDGPRLLPVDAPNR